MPDFPKLPIITPPPNSFPGLPIITPDPPRLTLQEKYGSFYYVGIAGLVVTLVLVGQFGVGLWLTRDYWSSILVLNSPDRPEKDRIQAAWTIAHHADSNDRNRFDFALRKELPILARYILAEGLTSESIRADPKAYALMVAKSEGWPDWLRLLMARPLAYGAVEGYRIAWEPLDLLRENPDPALALWATFTRAVMAPGDPAASKVLADAAGKESAVRPLAIFLDAAVKAEGKARVEKLDEATAWLRLSYPETSKQWQGWAERDGRLIETAKAREPATR